MATSDGTPRSLENRNYSVRLVVASLLVTLAAVSSCKKGTDTSEANGSKPSPQEPRTPETSPEVTASRPEGPVGTLRGTVRFTGEVPEMPAIQSGSDPECAKFSQHAETVLVNSNKTLRDVVVRITPGAVPGWVPSEKVQVNQKECMYRPRVQAAVEGQTLEFSNGDKTSHNVHAKHMPLRARQGTDSIVNRGQPAGSPAFAMRIHHASDVYEIRCDQHAWMRGYVVLSDNPYHGVTGDSGEVVLADVPAGSYKLQAWHAFYGLKEVEVTVKEGETAQFDFTYDAKADKPGAK